MNAGDDVGGWEDKQTGPVVAEDLRRQDDSPPISHMCENNHEHSQYLTQRQIYKYRNARSFLSTSPLALSRGSRVR